MIQYRIDRRSGVSTYMQIVHQTRQALRTGLLVPGDKLPTSREVVGMTQINPNTVLKAYRQLEAEGLVQGRAGSGTYVTQSLHHPDVGPDSPLTRELRVWVDRAHAAGLQRADIEALIKSVLDDDGSGTS